MEDEEAVPSLGEIRESIIEVARWTSQLELPLTDIRAELSVAVTRLEDLGVAVREEAHRFAEAADRSQDRLKSIEADIAALVRPLRGEPNPTGGPLLSTLSGIRFALWIVAALLSAIAYRAWT
jgi:hypothetical protein